MPTCSYDVHAGFALVRWTLNDHALATSPAQTIPREVVTPVTTPNGVFNVLWNVRTPQVVKSSPCSFCPGATVVTLVASRQSP